MMIFFKCPKCGSMDILNTEHEGVNLHFCYGCGYKWGGAPILPKVILYMVAVGIVTALIISKII